MAASDYGYQSPKKKIGFIFGLIGATIGMILLLLGSYIGYVFASYYRIGDKELSIERGATKDVVNVNETLTAATYNIGFGAYSQNFTFFMDKGYDENGKETCGSKATAQGYDEVIFNTNGSIKTMKDNDLDFIMMQEVDTYSTRSYRVNQDKLVQEELKNYDHTFACNYHSAFFPYPFTDMIGASNSGLSTFSKYKIIEKTAQRVEYAVGDGFDKIIDLDRCYSYQCVEVSNGKKLYIVNSHMSAYGDGDKIRTKQREQLRKALEVVAESGDYIVIGGDFNHDLLSYNPLYKNPDNTFKYTKNNKPFGETKKSPDWVSYLFDEDGSCSLLAPITNSRHETMTFSAYGADNLPSCRNNDIPWQNGKTYVVGVDGFICSDNVIVSAVETIPTNGGNLGTDYFAYSDHQPVKLTFKLL